MLLTTYNLKYIKVGDKMKVAYNYINEVDCIENNEVDCNETNEIAYKWTNEYCLKREKVKLLKKTN